MPFDKHSQFILDRICFPGNPREIGKGVRDQELFRGKVKKPDSIGKADVSHVKPDNPPVERKKHVMKNIESLQAYRRDPVTFDLYIKPNEILAHNPNKLQKPYVARIDESRKEARMSRPRLVISPAIAIDGITQDEVYDLVIFDTYQSEKMRMDRLLEENVKGDAIKAPLGQTYTNSNPIVDGVGALVASYSVSVFVGLVVEAPASNLTKSST